MNSNHLIDAGVDGMIRVHILLARTRILMSLWPVDLVMIASLLLILVRIIGRIG